MILLYVDLPPGRLYWWRAPLGVNIPELVNVR